MKNQSDTHCPREMDLPSQHLLHGELISLTRRGCCVDTHPQLSRSDVTKI